MKYQSLQEKLKVPDISSDSSDFKELLEFFEDQYTQIAKLLKKYEDEDKILDKKLSSGHLMFTREFVESWLEGKLLTQLDDLSGKLFAFPDPEGAWGYSIGGQSPSITAGFIFWKLGEGLFSTLFPIYCQNPRNLGPEMARILSDFVFCFNNQLLPIEMTIPIKGAHLPPNSVIGEPFLREESPFPNLPGLEVRFQSLQDYILLDANEIWAISTSGSTALFIKFLSRSSYFTSLPALEDGDGPKPNEDKETKLFEDQIFDRVKNILASCIYAGFDIGIGKPSYHLPWWMPHAMAEDVWDPTPKWLPTYLRDDSDLTLSAELSHLVVTGKLPDLDREVTRAAKYIILEEKNKEILAKKESPRTPAKNKEILLSYKRLVENLPVPEKPSLDLLAIHDAWVSLQDPDNIINFMAKQFLVDRLVQLRQRRNLEDIIIDAVLVLESVLFADATEELQFRFILYAVALSATSIEEVSELNAYFKSLYRFRSKIVHGAARDSRDYRKTLQDFVKHVIPSYKPEGGELSRDDQKQVLEDIFQKILLIIRRVRQVNTSPSKYFGRCTRCSTNSSRMPAASGAASTASSVMPSGSLPGTIARWTKGKSGQRRAGCDLRRPSNT